MDNTFRAFGSSEYFVLAKMSSFWPKLSVPNINMAVAIET